MLGQERTTGTTREQSMGDMIRVDVFHPDDIRAAVQVYVPRSDPDAVDILARHSVGRQIEAGKSKLRA
jgi:hypothetical protein